MQNLSIVPSAFFEAIQGLASRDSLVKFPRATPLSTIVKTMAERNIGCVVITDYDRPTGIFTERDLMRKIVGQKLDLDQELVEKHMTSHPVCIGAETAVIDAMNKMTQGKFRHLVLTDDEGLVSGVISVRDLLNFLAKTITEAMGSNRPAA
ncbi:MAG TPA: CBS domain-containing protein [Bdellovibrionota bacterium]|nr:CBS domain-containing protein [Bdellovibrionota bacterium]